MDKYTAEILEDVLTLIRDTILFIGISILVFKYHISVWWYLVLLFPGFRLREQRD